MTVHRRTGLLKRPVEQRFASLFLVASEDTYACSQYFEALQDSGILDARRVCVTVIPAREGKSSPKWVMELHKETEVRLKPMDERWLSLDRDRWTVDELADVAREAMQKGWFMAVSNPCFEAWLLLHLSDEPLPDTARGCEIAMRSRLGSYNKTNLPTGPWTLSAVQDAVTRARGRDTSPNHRWPQEPGTHLYRLVERLLPQTEARAG